MLNAEGGLISQEELWLMKPGDELKAMFWDASQRIVRLNAGKIELAQPPVRIENPEDMALALAERFPDISREAIDDFGKRYLNDRGALEVFGQSVSDWIMNELEQTMPQQGPWSGKQVYWMHLLVRMSDWAAMNMEVADFLQHLGVPIPLNVFTKLPPKLRERPNYTPERLARDKRRNELRAQRVAAQPKKGASQGKPGYNSKKS